MGAHAIMGTAGVSSPRPCPVFAGVVALSVLAHAALFVTLWQRAPRAETPRSPHVSLRLIVPPTQPTAAPPTAVRRASAAPRARAVAAAPPRPVSTESVDGSVFALPRFAFVSAAPTRWMASPPPPAPAAPPPIPLLQMQAQAARDAALAQIMSTLQQQAAAWAAPLEASDGTCLLAAEPTTPLACDNDALLALIGERVAMLSGLLSAYRRMEPRAASLSIALVQGHYRVALGLADEAQAPRQ